MMRAAPPTVRAARVCAVAGAALLLAACSRAPDQPGTLSADETQQLNDAAAMLDANSVDANALGNTGDPE